MFDDSRCEDEGRGAILRPFAGCREWSSCRYLCEFCGVDGFHFVKMTLEATQTRDDGRQPLVLKDYPVFDRLTIENDQSSRDQ